MFTDPVVGRLLGGKTPDWRGVGGLGGAVWPGIFLECGEVRRQEGWGAARWRVGEGLG